MDLQNKCLELANEIISLYLKTAYKGNRFINQAIIMSHSVRKSPLRKDYKLHKK